MTEKHIFLLSFQQIKSRQQRYQKASKPSFPITVKKKKTKELDLLMQEHNQSRENYTWSTLV